MYNYIVQNGDFDLQDDILIFKGRVDEVKDVLTGEIRNNKLYGEILFSESFKAGRISFNVTFSDVCEETRCGVLFGYSNETGTIKCHQAGIRNSFGGYSLDYYNGANWEFLIANGSNNSIKAHQKYEIAIETAGNVVKLYINDVLVFTYSKMIHNDGLCGIYICNNSKAEIESIKIDAKKPKAFAIMKYEKDFDELYHDVISPVCENAGYCSVRADECYTTSMIIQDIIREISEAAIIISDITMDNPNVFYELGYAHALNKPTILLADAEKRQRLPFDVNGYRTIFYSNSIGGKKEVETNLKKFLDNISPKMQIY